jgi:hypothetical protein
VNRKKYEYNQKYAKERLKRIPLDVQRTWYTDILAHAKGSGETVNGFIKRAIRETMERDNVAES